MPSYDEIKEIYENKYIKERLGTRTLNKQYPFDIAYWFNKYGFKLRSDREKK